MDRDADGQRFRHSIVNDVKAMGTRAQDAMKQS